MAENSIQDIYIPSGAQPSMPASVSVTPNLVSTPEQLPQTVSVPPKPPFWRQAGFSRAAKILGIALVILLIISGSILLFGQKPKENNAGLASEIKPIELELSDLSSTSGSLLGTRSITVNGSFISNGNFVISPSAQPSNANQGQIYYDQTSKQLAYYNGTEFVPVGGGVLTLQGQAGNVTMVGGAGIAVNGTTLSNTGVTSLGGAIGDITIGNGLGVTDGNLQNTGLLGAAGGTGISVTNDGAGNITISNIGSGTGTITSGGGTTGRIAKFTGAQNIEDSLISESGATITVNGDLSVTGTTTLSNPLTVGNGGTGATSLATNGVVISHGTGAFTAATSGAPGECLMSTAGAPAFGVCPGGGGGVTSLDGLTGALILANSSGVGTTVTIDDASTAQKGIAQFNATNFTGSGIINTVQNIHSGASPTFVGLTLSGDLAVNGGDITSTGALNITPGGTLTVGSTTQTLTLQGGATTSLSATSGASTTTLSFQTPTANVTYRLLTATAGAYDLCSTAGNCAGVGGGVTTAGGAIDRLAKFTAAQGIGNSTISDDGTNVSTTVDLIIQGGDVTVGVANTQTGTIKLAHSASGFLGSIVQGALGTTDRTYTLPDASGTFCLTSGNCSGGGSSNTLQAAYDAGQSITTTSGRDIDIVLSNDATDSNFDLVVADGSTSFVSLTRANGAGAADPAQMVLIDNLDTDRALPIGLKLQSAAGGMTTAIDASDAEIVDAISVGANNIVGTTGDINFDNFDVVGGTGNITTAGDLALNGGDITSTVAIGISNGAGNITINSTGTIELQDNTNIGGNINSTGNATLGNAAADTVTVNGTVQGATPLIFEGGAVDASQLSFAIAALSGDKTVTFGDEAGIVCLQGSANCGFATTGTTFIQNGNSFGGTAILGTNDNFGLNFEINNTAVATFTTTGAANFKNSSNTTSAFNVQDASSANLLTVDTTNSRVGINLGGSNTPSLATGKQGLELQGALRISGSTSTFVDDFTTPLGSIVPAKVNIIVSSPGTFGQLIAAGLPSSAPTSARALSLFDNRAGDHQQTLAVFAPNENNTVGFNWHGVSSSATVGTSDNAAANTIPVLFQSGNVTGGNGSSGDAYVTSGYITGGTGGTSGNLYLQTGNGSGSDSSSGLIAIDTGSKTGLGTNGAITIGTTNASGITIGKTGLTTLNNGGLTVSQIITATTLGTANTATHLCRNGSNQIAACNTTGTGAAYVQDGNSFGGAAVLGTNDANTLSLETNGTSRVTIGSTGGVSVLTGNAFTVAGGLTSLTGAGTGDALNVSNASSTGNIAVFKDNATDVAIIADGGATTFQNQSDSTTAFRVLKGSAVPLFVIDSTNSRAYIGNPSADSTGALLVLDTKNTSGDPTGLNGAMYYNSASGTFRCYENDIWGECLGTPKPNTQRVTNMVANGNDDVWGGSGDALTNTAPAGSGGTLSSNLVPSVYNDTTASIGSIAGVSGNTIYTGDRLIYQTHLDPTNTSVRIWAGLTTEDIATMGASATPAGEFAAFRYDTGAGDATWKCITRDGATATTTDSGVAIVDDQKFEILLDDGVRAVFKINGQAVCNITTTLPSAIYRVVNSITALDAATKSIYTGWIYVEGDPI